jgi:ArsR family transcriptional regulator
MNDDASTTVMEQASEERIAELAKALAHPMRVRIVRLLLSRPSCSGGEIFDDLPLAQSTVSQHLKVLKEAGIVGYEPKGTRGCYWAEPEVLAGLGEALGALLGEAATATAHGPGTCDG